MPYRFDLGISVSSLYGAPEMNRGSHGIGISIEIDLAFTVIPRLFTARFLLRAAYSTASCSTIELPRIIDIIVNERTHHILYPKIVFNQPLYISRIEKKTYGKLAGGCCWGNGGVGGDFYNRRDF